MKHTAPLLPLLGLLAACTGDESPEDLSSGAIGDPGPVTDADGALIFAAADDVPSWRGAGGPAVTFTEDQLWSGCAFLPGDDGDFDHHNLVTTWRGHLVLPWSPEFGIHGGISLWDVSDPCHPVKAGEGTSEHMRETHAMGFVHLPEGDPHAGDWAVVNGLVNGEAGIQVWNLDDADPVPVVNLALPGSYYPDSYTTVELAVFVQYPFVYASSADNGLFVIDVEDPTALEVVSHYVFDPGLRVGGVFALGNRLLATPAEGEEAALLDVSDPAAPQLMLGSPFALHDADGEPREAYHANMAGDLALFARKEGAGGPLVYDLSDPERPTWVADAPVPGSGGYVFYDEGFVFTGDSSRAHVFDARDLSDVTLVHEADLHGDLDTLTPYGNVAILAVDDPNEDDVRAPKGQASAVMPWTAEPDATAPTVLSIQPVDGATGVPVTSRIGVGFDEFVEPSAVTAGTLRLWTEDGEPVPGWGSGQETTASFAPKAPLEPGTTYVLEVVAGGIRDLNGNTLADTVTSRFTTAE